MIGRRGDAQAFDDALNRRAPAPREIAELVGVAESLCEAAARVEPGVAFRESLRTRLMTEAHSVLVPASKPVRPARQAAAPVIAPKPDRSRVRLARLSAAGFAVVGAVGMVSTSAQALPGDLLYPVKLGVENVELALQGSEADRGAFQLALANERLTEASRLAADGSPAAQSRVAGALESFTEHADSGSAALFAEYDRTGSTSSVSTVSDFTAAATAELAKLSQVLPPDANDTFGLAASAVESLASRAGALCSACVAADITDLAAAVRGLTGVVGTSKPEPQPVERNRESADVNPTITSGPTTAPPTSSPRNNTPSPTPTTPLAPPSLKDVTDPLLGGLLGNDEQEGLVPGLLNGLLGGKK